MSKSESITLNGIEYVPKGSEAKVPAKIVKGMKYVIARSRDAGVFAGYLQEKKGENVTLVNARRLWYWSGAASLSQLSQEGVNKPNDCKFPCEVPEVELNQVCEILPVTEKAKLSINSVKVWQM